MLEQLTSNNLIGFLTALPFALWYCYKLYMLRQLAADGVFAQAQVLNKLGRTILYQFIDGSGKNRRKQIALPRALSPSINKGDVITVEYLANAPYFSCPQPMLAAAIKNTKMLRTAAIVLVILLALAVMVPAQ